MNSSNLRAGTADESMWIIATTEAQDHHLGERHGTPWFRTPERLREALGDSEWEMPVNDRNTVFEGGTRQLGPGLWVAIANGDAWLGTVRHPLGTFARLTGPATSRHGNSTHAPADLLAAHWKLYSMPGTFSVAALVAQARRAGVLLALDATRRRVVKWYAGGRPLPIGHKVETMLELAEPLVVGFLANEPALCALDGCKSQPHPASKMAGPGIPWCGDAPEKAPVGARPESKRTAVTRRVKAAVGLA